MKEKLKRYYTNGKYEAFDSLFKGLKRKSVKELDIISAEELKYKLKKANIGKASTKK